MDIWSETLNGQCSHILQRGIHHYTILLIVSSRINPTILCMNVWLITKLNLFMDRYGIAISLKHTYVKHTPKIQNATN
jgi:hypothetical protein